MVATRRKIETDEDRYGGFSTRSNRFFSSDYDRPTQTSIDDFSYGNDNTSSYGFNTTSTDTDYEVEKEYKVNPSVIDEDEENDLIPISSFMPEIERKVVVEKPAQKAESAKINLSARGKILITAYSIITCLLIFLCVYNIFAIGNLRTSLDAKTSEYTQLSQVVGDLELKYESLDSANSVSNSLGSEFKAVSQSEVIAINLDDTASVIEVEKSTNWFNDFCEFLSNIFN